MSYPLYIVGGGAGSGKDTVAEMMVKDRNGVMIAQADPMKRFVMSAFGFTVEQLWGPSAARNALDERFIHPTPWDAAFERIFFSPLGSKWLGEIGANGSMEALQRWFKMLREKYEGSGLTPRAALQLLGTEFGRQISPDIWSDHAIRTAVLCLRGGSSYDRVTGIRPDPANPGHQLAVITDGRFRNEFLNVKALGGLTIQVYNPNDEADAAKTEAAGVKGHASEAELRGVPREWYDAVIRNDKLWGLPALRETVKDLMGTLANRQLDLGTFAYRNAQPDPRSQW